MHAEPRTVAEVVSIPIALIDRDPNQPRFKENVDTDLAPSFKANGWYESEPLEVRPHPELEGRYMLVDGERRLSGARAAGLKEALCILTFDAEGMSEADRLIRQVMHNTGKPLTPVEKAFAFRRIIDDRRAAGNAKYGPVKMEQDTGIPRQTISDALTLTEIPEFWLTLIAEGPLQPSHAPILHRWRKLPEKYQLHALEQMKKDPRWPGGASYSKGKSGERIYVSEFETLVRTYMPKFAKPVSDVPGYDGPTERMKIASYESPKVYAMDPARWQPIWRKKITEKKSAKGRQAAKTKQQNAARTPTWVKTAIEGGAQLLQRPYFSAHYFDSDAQLKGAKPIIDAGKWAFRWNHHAIKPFDPTVLLREQDLAKLVIVQTSENAWAGNSYHAVTRWYAGTRDTAAHGQACSAYITAERDAWQRILSDFGREMLLAAGKAGRDQLIQGGATPSLLKAMLDGDGGSLAELLFSYALAAEVPGAADVKLEKPAAVVAWLHQVDRMAAETILNAVAVAERDDLEPPPARLEAWQASTLQGYSACKIAWGETAPDPADDDADETEAVEQEEADDTEREPACKYCRCTEANACDLEDGPCAWYDRSVPVCTNPECVTAYQADVAAASAESEGADALAGVGAEESGE
jgi:ParB/RepB/Spo0J family partition protein